MPVSDSTSVSPLSPEQRKAAQALLRTLTPVLAELGELFVRAGHELALVGGRVRDVFLGTPPGDLDLTTDAVPEEVLAITRKWADKTWTVGIDFGTIGLRKGDTIVEITTYRSEQYGPRSRKPAVRYGTSLEEDLARRDFTINAMAARPCAGSASCSPPGSARAAGSAAAPRPARTCAPLRRSTRRHRSRETAGAAR